MLWWIGEMLVVVDYRKGKRRLVQYINKIIVAFIVNHLWVGYDDGVGDNQISQLTSTYRINNDRLVIACFLCCEYTHVHALTCLGDGCILVKSACISRRHPHEVIEEITCRYKKGPTMSVQVWSANAILPFLSLNSATWKTECVT
jgi:hypothetical protein